MVSAKELDRFYSKKIDPWGVLNKPDERNLKIKLSIYKYQFGKTLELGCGEGNFTKFFKKKNLYCNDISKVAIKRLKSKFKNIKTITKDFQTINFDKFDSIFAFECIYYLKNKDRRKFFKKIKKYLKNDKVFVFSAPIIGKRYKSRYFFTDSELKKVFKDLNVKLIFEQKLNYYRSKKFRIDYFFNIIYRVIKKIFSYLSLNKYDYLILNSLPERFTYQKLYVLRKR